MVFPDELVSIDERAPLWDQFFTVAPLVIVGSQEEDGGYNLAPKHMAMPMGWARYFGFVCTPNHHTYRNIKREGVFTVSYPRPAQILDISLTAAARLTDDSKPALAAVPTFPAQSVNGLLVADCYAYLECQLDRIIDGFDINSLIVGRVIAAHVHRRALRSAQKDNQDLIQAEPLLVYLDPGRFTQVDTSYSFPFPVDFSR